MQLVVMATSGVKVSIKSAGPQSPLRSTYGRRYGEGAEGAGSVRRVDQMLALT